MDPALAGAWADRLIAATGSVAAALAADAGRLRLILCDARAEALVAAHRAALLWSLRERVARRPLVATRHDLVRYLHHAMAHDEEESLRGFFVDVRRGLIAEEVLARGSADAVAVEPRQVLLRALALGAAGVMLVHNHPGGDPAASAADRRFTRRLATAAECLGIVVHDHLIVARDGAAGIMVEALPLHQPSG